jgi:IS30 family transposase
MRRTIIERALWSPEEDKHLIKLLDTRGLGLKEIGAQMNRSPKAIRRRCERLEISSSNVYKKKKS